MSGLPPTSPNPPPTSPNPPPTPQTNCYAGNVCQTGQTCTAPVCPPPKTGLSAGDIAAIILGILFLFAIIALIILLFFKHPKCPATA